MHLLSIKRKELTENKRNPSCRTKLILPHEADIHFDFHHLGHSENNFISDSARQKNYLYPLAFYFCSCFYIFRK